MTPAQNVIAQAISLASASWLALFLARQAVATDMHPLDGPEYEVSLQLTPGVSQHAVMWDGAEVAEAIVVVRRLLVVQPGKALHALVQPVAPRRT